MFDRVYYWCMYALLLFLDFRLAFFSLDIDLGSFILDYDILNLGSIEFILIWNLDFGELI